VGSRPTLPHAYLAKFSVSRETFRYLILRLLFLFSFVGDVCPYFNQGANLRAELRSFDDHSQTLRARFGSFSELVSHAICSQAFCSSFGKANATSFWMSKWGVWSNSPGFQVRYLTSVTIFSSHVSEVFDCLFDRFHRIVSSEPCSIRELNLFPAS